MIESKNINGVKEYTLENWDEYHSLIVDKIPNRNRNYVFRGQRNTEWKLEPTLNRTLKFHTEDNFEKYKKLQIENFKKSIRGRTTFYKDIIGDDREVWAIGQHHFLNTPLLDFTESPYVAAYFAFSDEKSETDYRIIYGISQKNISEKLSDDLELFTPVSDFNNRLISQSGLFVNFKTKKDLESLIVEKYREERDRKIKLFKIKIPTTEREKCLKSLNRMNINHNTLFPDLYGAAIYCNIGLKIENY